MGDKSGGDGPGLGDVNQQLQQFQQLAMQGFLPGAPGAALLSAGRNPLSQWEEMQAPMGEDIHRLGRSATRTGHGMRRLAGANSRQAGMINRQATQLQRQAAPIRNDVSRSLRSAASNAQAPIDYNSLAANPMFGAMKTANERGFQQARDRLMATGPAGGALTGALGGLEGARAGQFAQGMGQLAQNEQARRMGLMDRAMAWTAGVPQQALAARQGAANIRQGAGGLMQGAGGLYQNQRGQNLGTLSALRGQDIGGGVGLRGQNLGLLGGLAAAQAQMGTANAQIGAQQQADKKGGIGQLIGTGLGPGFLTG